MEPTDSPKGEVKKYVTQFGGKELTIETGKLATLATGSVTVTYGETTVLATVVVAEEPRDGVDFFPLLVDYEERLYAAGKISGSRFIKRETRPSDRAILTCRMIDRPLRPLFPKSYRNDVQIIITVLSFDGENDPDIVSMIAASAALMQTHAPYSGPIGAVRMGYIDGQFVVNPTISSQTSSQLNVVVAGLSDRVLMLESDGNEASEDQVKEAIKIARQAYQPVIDLQNELAKDFAQVEPKYEESENALLSEVKTYIGEKIAPILAISDKIKREMELSGFEADVLKNFEGAYKLLDVKTAFGQIVEKEIRKAILDTGIRPDGRQLDEIRPITVDIDLLPRTHGSGLFTRGQTQVMTIATLGSPGEEQVIDTMEEDGTKRYMHHYNFPPFATNEVRPLRGASRREIGHGALAEKALIPVLPSKEDFPYTIRLVSEVLSSNGSTSMAATCGSTLALMAAGVPIKAPVAGIAMGLMSKISENGEIGDYKILTDIQGIEDFGGDMDFKVTGTEKGITAIQMDTKTHGLTDQIIADALEGAKVARLKILEKIKAVISEPRQELSKYAPRISTLKINPDKIRDVIGSGGKTINKIIQESGGPEVLSIDIEQDGLVMLTSTNADAAEKARQIIGDLTREVAIGEVYSGKVVRILDFGAIVELWPGQDGMVHISQMAPYRIATPADILKIGDEVKVRVDKAEDGKVSLSMKGFPENEKYYQKS